MGWPYHQKPPLGWPIDSDEPLAQGLVAMWLNQEGATTGGTVQDLSGNGNTGTLVADTHSVPGKFGPALDFDGTGDWVEIPHSELLGMSSSALLTLVCWVKADSWSQAAIFIRKRNGGVGYQLFQESGVLKFHAGTENTGISIDCSGYSTAKWYYIVAVCDGSFHRLYIDGIERDSVADTSLMGDSSANVLKFGAISSGSYDLDGQIDHVLIYNRALTAGEIGQLYLRPFGMFKSPQDIILLNDYSVGGVTVPLMYHQLQIAAGAA